ncbi:hypothetical protein AMTR_s00062p00111290 [Amborella trichopoda]|uniref:Uncharacterized protein n=1 Tax=Amborella trichopoda TaxID=13333 RepID=U5DBM0_AMBTC|nr:hypothetical protein AMTR_s00062p00111290 [Amborella trichopoda]
MSLPHIQLGHLHVNKSLNSGFQPLILCHHKLSLKLMLKFCQRRVTKYGEYYHNKVEIVATPTEFKRVANVMQIWRLVVYV